MTTPLLPPINSAAVTGADVNEEGITFYTVELSCQDKEESVVIMKRYSEFRSLHSALKKKHPKLKDVFPKFPPKLLSTTPRDIEIRWEKLDQFIRFVAQNKLLSRDETFLKFVYE